MEVKAQSMGDSIVVILTEIDLEDEEVIALEESLGTISCGGYFPDVIPPQFVGGQDSIYALAFAYFEGYTIESDEVVKVRFTIDSRGQVINAEIFESGGEALDNMVLSFVKTLHSWEPAREVDTMEPVAFSVVLPFRFHQNTSSND